MPDQLRPMLPDPPRKVDLQGAMYFSRTGVQNSIGRHLDCYPFRLGSTTLVAGNGYICPTRDDWPGAPYPNLVIAFDVDPAAIVNTNGYVISEVGKPPDFVMEMGYDDTYLPKYPDKKADYQRFAIPEYWRYDHTGGKYYGAALDGYRLSPDGVYRPIEIRAEPDGVIWGYSEVLKLSLCWVARRLRFWDYNKGRYVRDLSEEQAARIAEQDARIAAEKRADADIARTDAANARAAADKARTDAAEARIRRLEAELRRRENP